MKKVIPILSLFLAVVLLAGCGQLVQTGDCYCRYCGKKIPAGSSFCPYCGADLNGQNSSSVAAAPTVITPTVTAYPTAQPQQTSSPQQNVQIVEITFAKSQRSIGGEFKDRQVDYNVFAKEIEDCCGCSFYYCSWKRKGSKNSPTGMNEVYVRSKRCEDNNDDDGWIYVGSFNYTNEGKSFLVEMSWLPTDVYSVAVVNSKIDPYCVYSSSWGNEVIFYAVK